MLAHVAPFEALLRRQRGHRPGSFSSPSSGGGLAPWALHRGLSPGGSGFQRELHVEAGVNGPGPSRGLFSQFRARPEFKFEFRPRDRSADGIRTSPNTPKRVALHEPQGHRAHEVLVAREGGADLLPGARVPQPHGLVVRRAGEPPALGRPGYRVLSLSLSLSHGQRLRR